MKNERVQRITLPDATHGLQVDNPGNLHKMVLTFIDKH